jgi:carbon monoxide dehydrogenase subunit G
MASESEFVSPTGTITADSTKVFSFVSDLRNFTRFIPEESVRNWVADKDSCSFDVSPVGQANVSITERVPITKVKFEGTALQNIEFRLWVQLIAEETDVTKFRIVLKAVLNPFYKMMATKPINNFLEKVVNEIEKFDGWDDFRPDTQSP